jgi:hypothetical protein
VTFNSEVTELTTAATDVVIAIVALMCMTALRRHRAHAARRVAIWTWVFGLLAFAAVLGAFAHGIALPAETRQWLWRPLYLSLGLVVALFVVGAVYDVRGEAAARAGLLPMLTLGVVFFVITQVVSGAFLVFVVYEAAAMLAALSAYTVLAIRRRLEGAGTIAVGIIINIAAAAIQATGTVSVEIIVPFDHNGVFHLVQIVALGVMAVGLARGMTTAENATGT